MSDLLDRLNLPATPLDTIHEIEAAMLAAEPAHGIQLATRMLIWGDIVLRTVEIPADTLLAGVVHQQEHLALSVGAIVVWEDGGVREMIGAHEWVSPAGGKRVGRTLAATAWTTIHRIPEGMSDPAEIERYICGADAAKLVTVRNPDVPNSDALPDAA